MDGAAGWWCCRRGAVGGVEGQAAGGGGGSRATGRGGEGVRGAAAARRRRRRESVAAAVVGERDGRLGRPLDWSLGDRMVVVARLLAWAECSMTFALCSFFPFLNFYFLIFYGLVLRIDKRYVIF